MKKKNDPISIVKINPEDVVIGIKGINVPLTLPEVKSLMKKFKTIKKILRKKE